jgi:hypothetical protein
MVTTRGLKGFAETQKRQSKEWFTKFGRDDITLTVKTETKDSFDRLTAISTSSTTIIGDLQFDLKLLSQYIQLGIAQTGDGIFYTLPDVSISINNEITVDSVVWRLVQQVEGEQTNGQLIYQGWIARRTVA